jgi:hypothetical protein
MRNALRAVVAALALLAATAAGAHAAAVPVHSLTGAFGATNSSVIKAADGVRFGLYADAGRTGGSLVYGGANGLTLGQITGLGYTYNYNTSNDVPVAAPYLRVFLDGDGDGTEDSDVIFDPTVCGSTAPPENTDVAVDVTAQQVRFDDDPGADCANTQASFAAVRAANAGAVVTGIYISQGFSAGADASAIVRNLTVNSDTFAFDVPPAAGQNLTNIVRIPVLVPTARPVGQAVRGEAASSCRGDELRRIRAPRRSGARFVRVNATLRGRPLKTDGRTVTVDLRERREGNYNVRLIIRYRTKAGRVHRVVTRRNLSVACS